MKSKEILAEAYADIHMDKFDLTKAKDLPYHHNDRDKIEEAFTTGFSASKRITDKIILDILNKLRSELSNAERVKLTKVINKEKIELLKAQIDPLLKLQNKLKC